MVSSTIDLHIHSHYSLDGELGISDILALCKNEGLETISIADHNTVKGVKEAEALGEITGIKVIPAIEIDCEFCGINLHLLGYGIDPENSELHDLEKYMMDQECEYIPKIINRLNQIGFTIEFDEAQSKAGEKIPSPELVAEVLLESQKNLNNELLQPYRKGGNRSDMPLLNFYRDYFTKGKNAYIKKEYISLEEAISMVSRCGGLSVLAHPGESLKGDTKVLDLIIQQKIHGLEVFSSYHNKDQTAFLLKGAKETGLIYTCGSDFHGKNKPTIDLGSVDCCGMEKEIIKNVMGTK